MSWSDDRSGVCSIGRLDVVVVEFKYQIIHLDVILMKNDDCEMTVSEKSLLKVLINRWSLLSF